MKKLLICLLLLPSLAWGQEYARMNPYILGGVSAAACVAPSGSIFTEGFETATTGYELTKCGSAPCWTESGTVDPAHAITEAGTDGCNQGLQTASTGTAAYIYYNLNTTVTNGYFLRAKLKINSESLNQWQIFRFYSTGTSAIWGTSAWLGMRVMEYSAGSSDLRIMLYNGSNSSTAIAVPVGSWITIDACIPDGGESGNFCGTGTNGLGWISIDGGSTKQTLAAFDGAGQQYFFWGISEGSKTIDIDLAYIAIDADGNF